MSKYVDDLRDTANTMATHGFDLSAAICRESAKRMQRLESFITDLVLQIADDQKEKEDGSGE